ncbi:MAG: nucleotidyltransferase domain-containing protein [Nanoarchaeota archaeon]|nr:nucleotidyltransferase domain-containing protein [Nanoarchaeota archaeon]
MITKNIKMRIKNYFFENPTVRLRVRAIERETKSALPSVIRYTKELQEEEILKKQLISNVTFFSANRSSKKYLLQKKQYNIERIYSSGLLDFLIEQYSNPTIILFGSYSKGEDFEESDIDIYLQTENPKKSSINTYEKYLSKKIQLFQYKSLKQINNKELANNIINGQILNGFLEVF